MKPKTLLKQERIFYEPVLEKFQPDRDHITDNTDNEPSTGLLQDDLVIKITKNAQETKFCYHCGQQIHFYAKTCPCCETSQPELLLQTNEIYFKPKYNISNKKKQANKALLPDEKEPTDSDFFFQNQTDNDFSEHIILYNKNNKAIKIKPFYDNKKILTASNSQIFFNNIIFNNSFIKRDFEYNLLYDKARKLNYGKGCLVIIQGEPGIGKSALKVQFIKNISLQNNFLEVQLKPLHKESDYTVMIQILRKLFNCENSLSEKEMASRTELFINKLLVNKEDYKYNENDIFHLTAILKLYLSGLIHEDEIAYLNNLDNEQKEELFLKSFEKILTQAAINNFNNIIVIENAQYTDKKSYQFIKKLVVKLNQFPLMFLIITNSNWYDTHNISHENLSILRLNYFAKDEIIYVLSSLFKNRTLSLELKEFIWNYSLGNPFVAKNLIKFLFSNGYVKISDNILEMKHSKTIYIPQSLKQLIQIQISSLTQIEKQILYFYTIFTKPVTMKIFYAFLKLSGIPENEVKTDLIIQNFCLHDFLEESQVLRKNRNGIYAATDSAMTYIKQLLDQKEKERIHHFCAVIIEKTNMECIDSVLDNLIYHYENSKNFNKIFYFKKRKADLLNFNLGDKKTALDLYLNCLNNISLLSTDTETLDLYFNLGSLYFDIYNNAIKAISLIDRGLCIAENLNDNYLIVRAWEIKSDIYLKTGQFKDALSITMNIKDKAEEIADVQMLVFANQRLGLLYKNHDIKKSICYYKKAADLISKNSIRKTDKSTFLEIYIALAELYTQEQDQDKAIKYYEDVLKMLDFKKNKPFICELLQKLAFCFLKQKKFNQAINCLDETNILIKEIKDQIGLINLKKNYGQLYLHEKEYTKAMDYFNSALYFAKKHRNNKAEGQLLCKIGECYYNLKKPAIALSHVQNGITYMERIHDKQGLAESGYWLLSAIKFDLKDIIGAKRALQDQYRLAKELKKAEYIYLAKDIETQIKELTQGLTI